jgi:hypothetical protein
VVGGSWMGGCGVFCVEVFRSIRRRGRPPVRPRSPRSLSPSPPPVAAIRPAISIRRKTRRRGEIRRGGGQRKVGAHLFIAAFLASPSAITPGPPRPRLQLGPSRPSRKVPRASQRIYCPAGTAGASPPSGARAAAGRRDEGEVGGEKAREGRRFEDERVGRPRDPPPGAPGGEEDTKVPPEKRAQH